MGESDFALTYSIHEDETPISTDMVNKIEQIDGIEDVRLTYAAVPAVTIPVSGILLSRWTGKVELIFLNQKIWRLIRKTFMVAFMELIAHM